MADLWAFASPEFPSRSSCFHCPLCFLKMSISWNEEGKNWGENWGGSRGWWGFPGGSDGKASACDAGDPGAIPGRSPGEGNGTPLQYSCLENPMDGGAWWATVRGVAKSRTGLSGFTFTFGGWWLWGQRLLVSAQPTLVLRVKIYFRLEKGWRLFLDNSLLKSCQNCPNTEGLWHWLSRGREFSSVKFMRLGWKRSWGRAWRIPVAKWLIFVELEDLFLSPLFSQLLHFIPSLDACSFLRGAEWPERDGPELLRALPSRADPAAWGGAGQRGGRLSAARACSAPCDPRPVARRPPPSTGSPGRECWSGCHALLQGISLTRGRAQVSRAGDRLFTTEPPGKPGGCLGDRNSCWEGLPKGGRKAEIHQLHVVCLHAVKQAWRGCQCPPSNNRMETAFYSFPCLRLGFRLCRFKLLHISSALARVPCNAKIGDCLQ